jgi:hypothetical protein
VGSAPDDREKRRRVLAVNKSNVAAIAPSLGFQLVVDADKTLPRVHWLGISRHKASDLTQAQGSNEGREAEDFLRERATREGVPSKPLMDEARELDIAPITLRRAKKRLGIEAYKSPDGLAWWWRFPGEESQGDHTLSDDHLRGKGGTLDDHLPRKGDAWEGPDHD